MPDDLVARLKARANRHRRSLNNETIAALELADAVARGTTPQPAAEPVDIHATLRRMQEISAGLRARAAAEARPVLELPPPPPMTEEEKAAERENFARLRS